VEVQFHLFLTSAQNGSNGAVTPNLQDTASTTLTFLNLENKNQQIWSCLKWKNVHSCLYGETELTERVVSLVAMQQRCRPLYGEQSREQKNKSIQIFSVHYMGEFADSMSGFRRRVDTFIKLINIQSAILC
jgi:hypothetical protein